MNVGRRITLNFRNKGWGIWTGVVENVDEEKGTVDIGWDNFTQDQKKELFLWQNIEECKVQILMQKHLSYLDKL